MDSNVSLYEDTLKFYFVQIGDEPSEEIRFAREVSAIVLCWAFASIAIFNLNFLTYFTEIE